MSHPKYINELTKNTLSKKGYGYLLSLFLRIFSSYSSSGSIPKAQSDVSETSNQKENTALFHGFLKSLIGSNSLKYIAKIPDSYKIYFFINKLIQSFSKEESITSADDKTNLQISSFQDQITEIANAIEYSTLPIILDLFFVDPIPSIDEISAKYSKSPERITNITATFRRELARIYQPKNMEEGAVFLEELHHYLVKINKINTSVN